MGFHGCTFLSLSIKHTVLSLSIARVIVASALSLSLLACTTQVSREQFTASHVQRLMEKMTLNEKIQLLHGTQMANAGAGAIAGIPRLGIPPMLFTDGPAGIRNAHYVATAMPAPVSLAATFNSDLAYQYGAVLGKEARMLDQDVLLSPMVNSVRTPQAGRNFETLGEDPVLAGEMVSAEIKGIQDAGTMATVKHFVVNNQETQRMTINTRVGEQALREIYLPPFKQAVQRAQVASVMCAYNKIAINRHQSHYACANSELLTQILRTDWGFDGFVVSDWYAAIPGVFTDDANPSPDPIKTGLDVEMPGDAMFGQKLLDAVNRGEISESYVDRSVYRVLSQMDRFGLLDGTQKVVLPTVKEPKFHQQIAEKVAAQGAVLLKNTQQMLPLHGADLVDLLVVGPTAASLNYGGGGSSRVKPNISVTSPLMALRKYAGSTAHIRYLPGIHLDGEVIPGPALMSGLVKGLLRQDAEGHKQRDPIIDYTDGHALFAKETVVWDGAIVAPESGTYVVNLQTKNGVAKLSLDGGKTYILDTASVFNANNSVILTADGLENASVSISLRAGEKKRLHIEATSGQVGAFSSAIAMPDAPMSLRLAWQTPSQQKALIQQAVDAAKTAKAVVVFGFNEGTEGVDRPSLALPYDQDTLISKVASVNKKVAVVLNTGDAVTMPWVDHVESILQMWYPGQYGGEVTAKLLLGELNPSGRLPISYPESEQMTWLKAKTQFPGVSGQLHYDEGIFVGYRWFDKYAVRPLFPFGYGLSYTEFSYSRPKVIVKDKQFTVTFRVSNTGERDGEDVPQLYLGAPAQARVPVAVRKLVAFKKVALKAGKSTNVTLTLDLQPFKYWDTKHHQWSLLPGKRPLYLGHSVDNVKKIAVLNPGI